MEASWQETALSPLSSLLSWQDRVAACKLLGVAAGVLWLLNPTQEHSRGVQGCMGQNHTGALK